MSHSFYHRPFLGVPFLQKKKIPKKGLWKKNYET